MLIEGNCPNSYAYAFDESSGTALWTCPSTLYSNYTLTFCPCGSLLFPSCVDRDSRNVAFCVRIQASGWEPGAHADIGRPVFAHPKPHSCRLKYVFSHRDVHLCALYILTIQQRVEPRRRGVARLLAPPAHLREAKLQMLRSRLVQVVCMSLGLHRFSCWCRVPWRDGSWCTKIEYIHVLSYLCYSIVVDICCCIYVFLVVFRNSRQVDIRNDKPMVARDHPIVHRITKHKHILRLPVPVPANQSNTYETKT